MHSFKLSKATLKWGGVFLAAGLCMFVGAFIYAVYGQIHAWGNDAENRRLRQVNVIQQEQLLELSKKAGDLQATAKQLQEQETELRRLAGASPTAAQSDENAEEVGEGGEGGPFPSNEAAAKIYNLLARAEADLSARKESLDDLSAHIKSEREKAAAFVMPNMAAGSFPLGIMPGGATPSLWPARGVVSSPYGLRWGGTDFHPGIDIANDMGTPIVAAADGTVDYAGWNAGGYGNMVDIDHGNGLMTRYAHAMQVVVVTGQHVRKGQLIAYMGSTGFSTGPHVHYEVRINGRAVNPVGYL